MYTTELLDEILRAYNVNETDFTYHPTITASESINNVERESINNVERESINNVERESLNNVERENLDVIEDESEAKNDEVLIVVWMMTWSLKTTITRQKRKSTI